MPVPNVGDILTLSRVAWETGRAFDVGREYAPTEFQAVGTDVTSLAQALKQIAETLQSDADDSLIHKSLQQTQDGIATILSSCQRTVRDLDSLVDRYQVTRKHRTVGGFAIERSWSDLVLSQYETIIWTTQGGSLDDLSSLLQMHTRSIRLLAEAIQSKSLTQLENVVTPMAERFDSMYDLPGTLEDQLDEVSRFVQELTITNPTIPAPTIPQRNPARSSIAEIPGPLSTARTPLSPSLVSPAQASSKLPLPYPCQRSASMGLSMSRPTSNDASPESADNRVAMPMTPPRKRVSELNFGGSSARDSVSSYASSISSGLSLDSLGSKNMLIPTIKSLPLPRTPELSESVHAKNNSLTLLPLPATRPSSTQSTQTIERTRSSTNPSTFSTPPDSIARLHRSSTTASQKATFEKEAFRNSAILCDVRGRLVEFSQHTSPNPDSDLTDIEMVEACDTCRITVVRKRITDPETKNVRVVTSIWALSDDNNVRVELRMEDGDLYIPYSSYFSPMKVSMAIPCDLRFHDVKYGNRLTKTARTSWVNYVFENAQAAALFQNEIMGRILLATFRTCKTMRIHEGTLSSFAYAEQMCALENLRIWEDTDTGAVIGLIHFSASFRAGYLAFYLNSSSNPVTVKDEGGREVKIRGLRVPVGETERAVRKDSVADDGDTNTESIEMNSRRESGSRNGGRRTSGGGMKKSKGKGKTVELDRKKVISGAKIEFASETEKQEFLDLVEVYQRPARLCELPDLLNVN